MTTKPKIILIVEDEADDLFFIKTAFAEAGITNPIHEAQDCQAAIDYLTGSGKFADREQYPMPALIFLDLRLPDKSGLEVLRKIRDTKLRTFSVVVFTSSSHVEDVKAAYEAGASSYVVKPLSAADRKHFAMLVKEYWLGFNLFPPS
jgi:CheY-like chemotaxis protein